MRIRPSHRLSLALILLGVTSVQRTASAQSRALDSARSVTDGEIHVVAFGRTQPILHCALLRACVIRLQGGERLQSPPAIGDSERWLLTMLTSGPTGETPLLVLKPTECDLTTDLVVSTTRRVYLITLDVPPCTKDRATGSNDPHASYTRLLSFSYPDDPLVPPTLHVFTPAVPATPTTPAMTPDRLNFEYRITKDRAFPWSPSHVFDDGVHTYIRVPNEALHGPAPVLFLVNDDQSRALLNYTVVRNIYVTDRVLRRAQLVLSEGGKEVQATITQTGSQP